MLKIPSPGINDKLIPFIYHFYCRRAENLKKLASPYTVGDQLLR